MLTALHWIQWAPLGWILGLHLWNARSPLPDRFRSLLELLTGPWMLLPTAIGLIFVHARYEGNDIGHLQTIPIAFQGSGDYAGSNLYSWIVACLLWFGVTGSIYLDLLLARAPSTGLLRYLRLRMGLHWMLLLGLTGILTYDGETDERNILLFAVLIFALTVLLTLRVRHMFLSKVLLILAILLASDGTSPKAGHVPDGTYYTGPAFPARGLRHSCMLYWHMLCNRLLGGPALTPSP